MPFQLFEPKIRLPRCHPRMDQRNWKSLPRQVGTAPDVWRHAFLLVAALATLALLSACGERIAIPTVGQPVPEVALPDLEGKTVNLSDFRGEVVLLNFWATWCPPCVDEMPSLQKLQKALGEKGLNILAISVDEKLEDIERFRDEFQLDLPILRDSGAKVAHSFATFKFPETYIVGRDGRLMGKVIGPRDWIAPLVIRDFVELLRDDEWNGI